MRGLAKKLVSFLKKEDGPTAIEYAFMLALIIAVCALAVSVVGTNTNDSFSHINSSIKQ
jgi:pilus assembly protein Flp/PilA